MEGGSNYKPLGLWLEDFVLGEVRTSAGRTVTEADIVAFAGVTGDYSRVHTDAEHMRNSIFGKRIAHGLLGLSIAQGLMWRTNYTDGTGVASLGWDKWRFQAPIFIGDTVHVLSWAVSKRPSKSRPEHGIVVEKVELRNQANELVQEGEHTTLMRRKVHD